MVLDAAHGHAQVVPISGQDEELYPPHPPREDTPEYQATHKLLVYTQDTPCFVCGVKQSTLGDPTYNAFGAKQMETHHWPVQREYIDAVDWRKVAKKFPQVTDREALLKFVDSPDNMLVLCVTGDAPVLLANGTYCCIADLREGDTVLGHDGEAHIVKSLQSRYINEDIVTIDGIRFTNNHPILTNSGWQLAGRLNIGEIVADVRVVPPNMFTLRSTDFQIFEPVVESVSIDMMHTLSGGKPSSDSTLDNPPVFENIAPTLCSLVPYNAASVPSRCNLPASRRRRFRTLSKIQSYSAALVRAEFAKPSLDLASYEREFCAAYTTRTRTVPAKRVLPSDATTFSRTSRVSVCERCGNQILVSANDARVDDTAARSSFVAGWRSIEQLFWTPFSGRVYDIGVEKSRTFIAGNFVVHNCDVHHRGSLSGAHHMLFSDFHVQPYLFDGYKLEIVKGDEQKALADDEAIVNANVPENERG